MSNQYNTEKTKILLVDSNAENIALLKEIISSQYTVIDTSPEDVFEILSNGLYDIASAIIDIRLAAPIVKKLRGFIPTEKIPILISTDIENSDLEAELLTLEVLDFLKKPYDERRVLNRLKTAIKLAEANKAIDELERDALTGLLTRKAFLLKTEQFIAANPEKKYSLIAFDFDNFKSSNSLYGVEKCNEFLAFTAREMMKALPEGISGRYGGDQYILFFESEHDFDMQRLTRISKLILDKAPIPHQIVKMGIYTPIDVEIPIVICCDRAFLSISRIKGKYGKDYAFFEDELQSQLLNEQRITETMERALEECQFQVFYQPKHETISGNIAGAEALVRWNHPEYGFMSPGQFIPLFERNGFIVKLDCFVLEQVCKDIQRWKQDGLPLVPISVNVSRRDFIESGCIDKQYQIVEKYNIDHSLIHMEVTESLYSENTDLIISQVKRTQEMGFVIEMDDFGAGYSSLGSLSTFPLNVLKLDISFVRNIVKNEIVIENIIKMAHRMGLLVIAEGAETVEQFKILRTLGCDYIQGYYFSKPLPVKEFEAYLKKSSVLSCGNITLRDFAKTRTSLSEDMLMAANEVAEGIPGGFFSYHADGGLELISFNNELIRMYGCSTAEEFRDYVGNSFCGIVHPDDFTRVQRSIDMQITEHNNIDYVEYRIKAKDGSVKYVKDYGRFVKTKNYGDIFYVFLNDITLEERAKADAEAELVRKIELQRTADLASNANRAKNIFMYNVSHNILEDMQTMVGLTNEIKNSVKDNSAALANIKKIEKSEEHMLSFINNVYELAQMENGDIQLNEVPIDITKAMEKTYALIEKDVNEKGIEVEYWSEITNPYIYQDIMHTTNVVMNILMNAIKYTPEGGKIRFGLRQEQAENPNECIITFICEDTGIGISPEFIPYICKSFAREDNEVNASIQSAGLGLSIAKTLLYLMNGTIDIKSEIGKGTTVTTRQPHLYAKKEEVERSTSLTGNVHL
ncbi:PAS domain S-box-containing protein/diguanylate cyclase (GGDEF) domain-containing protein [Treponema bryantii]|uniref:histidine kinase n=1 Tax=Treponema bryantii TaxID=163 RepID=A0A1H9CA41_9SPIR|nr:PAS domain S-box-containing protein/diguanylate cyclase (GGDEF) domain-containing protein [Treponema bryantii]